MTLGTSISYDALGNSYTSGSYTTNATSIDGYGTVKASETIGKSGRDIGLATEKILGTYTTDLHSEMTDSRSQDPPQDPVRT